MIGGGGLRTLGGLGVAAGVIAVVGLALTPPSDAVSSLAGWAATVGLYGVALIGAGLLAAGLRRRPGQTLLLCGSLLVTALLAELVLRAAVPPSWPKFEYVGSRHFHHLAKPGLRMFAGTAEGEAVVVETNADGLRTTYDRESFARHRHRIIVMGDSFAFGFRVTQEAAVPQQLEQILRSEVPDGDVAVLNAGLISYSPFLGQRLFADRLASYDPTLVLYLLDCSDIGDDAIYATELQTGPEGSWFDVPGPSGYRYYGAIVELLRRAGVTEALRRPLDALAAPKRGGAARGSYYDFEVSIDGVPQKSRYFIFKHPLAKTRRYFETTFNHVRSLARSVEVAGARFILVVTPRFQHWSQRECPGNWEAKHYAREEPWQGEIFRFFAEKSREGEVAIVDLLPRFLETEEFPLVFAEDPHWNRRGHAFVAGALASILREGGYLE
jgi:hypothetical protein